jgi:hypothetical protein
VETALSSLDEVFTELKRIDGKDQESDEYKFAWVDGLALQTKLYLDRGQFDSAVKSARETVVWAQRIENNIDRSKRMFQSYTALLAALSAKLEEFGYDAKLATEAEDTFFLCVKNENVPSLPQSLLEDFMSWTAMELAHENFSRVILLVTRFLDLKFCSDPEILKKAEIIRIVSLLSVGGWDVARAELRKAQEVTHEVRGLFTTLIDTLDALEKVNNLSSTQSVMAALQDLVGALGMENQPAVVGAQLIQMVLSRAGLPPALQRQLQAHVAALYIEHGDLDKAEKILKAIDKSSPAVRLHYDEADSEVFIVKGQLIKARAAAMDSAGESPSITNWGAILSALAIVAAFVFLRWSKSKLQAQHDVMSNEYQKLMEESHKLTDASKVQNPATAQHVQQARTITQDLKRMSAISSRTLREY